MAFILRCRHGIEIAEFVVGVQVLPIWIVARQESHKFSISYPEFRSYLSIRRSIKSRNAWQTWSSCDGGNNLPTKPPTYSSDNLTRAFRSGFCNGAVRSIRSFPRRCKLHLTTQSPKLIFTILYSWELRCCQKLKASRFRHVIGTTREA